MRECVYVLAQRESRIVEVNELIEWSLHFELAKHAFHFVERTIN